MDNVVLLCISLKFIFAHVGIVHTTVANTHSSSNAQTSFTLLCSHRASYSSCFLKSAAIRGMVFVFHPAQQLSSWECIVESLQATNRAFKCDLPLKEISVLCHVSTCFISIIDDMQMARKHVEQCCAGGTIQ